MSDKPKNIFQEFGENRIRVLSLFIVALAGILILRLFILQIIRGSYYQENYTLKLVKTESIDPTRGNIYDRNGKLLAYNDLAYAVTILDNGVYATKALRHEKLNEEIATIITNLKKNGDSIDNDFKIQLNAMGEYEFTVTGTALQRFRADMYDKTYTMELGYDKELGYDTAEATADQVMDYLCNHRFYIADTYDRSMQYEIAIVRYGMALNAFQKYISTVIASNVSERSVAYIEENKNELQGVNVEESTIRKYNGGECFAGVIGYTGTISPEEYDKQKETDDSVEKTDTVGKAGIEQYMNDTLQGRKGSQTLAVDSVGNPLEMISHDEPEPGKDVYLSLDADLQEETYSLLEQEIAGIVYSKIQNIKEFDASKAADESDIIIPIYDVYYSLLNNGVIDMYHFSKMDATELEKSVQSVYESREGRTVQDIRTVLTGVPVAYEQLPKERQEFVTFVVKMLREMKVLDTDDVDPSDEIQTAWTSEQLSVNDYLKHAIEEDWIDITVFAETTKYVDTEELYTLLVDYIIDHLAGNADFTKLVYKYAILNDEISGETVCALLYDQNVLAPDEDVRNALLTGEKSGYTFLREKISSLELTPAQLALDPCSGSSVVIDSTTGEVLACVSYPGYDNNKLANPSDSSYYGYLSTSLSNPLYNRATQQRTAPGSTFKIVSSTAGLAEGVITTTSEIEDLGKFDQVSNKPKCWIYPRSTHGKINVSEAIRDSCNYFFYQVGYSLAGGTSWYNDANGIEKLNKYADIFGLDAKTGIEIEETTSQLATEYPVMAAIGQSDNNITTIALARYCAAIANSGTVYDLTLLDHIGDSEGNRYESFHASVRNTVDVLDASQWAAIHNGMRMVVESNKAFKDFPVDIAGKTGTAQQTATRPNHALFIGYAPFDNPKIAVATRIAYGYSSTNAANVSKHIIGNYFNVKESRDLAEGRSINAISNTTTSNTVTD